MFTPTKQEKVVLLFLAASFLLGLGINLFLKSSNSFHNLLSQNLLKDQPYARFKLNLNKVDTSSLIELPGIGPVIASRIIKYRQQHGRFNSLEELKNIDGIGEKKLQKLRHLLTIE